MSEQITPKSFAEVIALWPKPRVLAAEISKPPGTVRQWKGRDSIDPVHFPAVAAAALKWGHAAVTIQLLESLYRARYPRHSAPAAAGGPSEYA